MGIWNQIKLMNPLKRKVNMKQEELTMATQDEANEVKRFQWIKGDNFGDVVEVSHEDTEFYYFTNGSQIFKAVHREFLMPMEGTELPLPVANETPVIDRLSPVQTVVAPQSAQTTKAPVETPLEKLILKLSQKNVESINVKLGINIPKREVVEMLIENSDESRNEILESITKMAVAQITIDKLQDFITEEVNSHLNKYYNE
jgi:hypothetical protein